MGRIAIDQCACAYVSFDVRSHRIDPLGRDVAIARVAQRGVAVVNIRPMRPDDIEATIFMGLAAGWRDLRRQLAFYLAHPQCHVFVADDAGDIVGHGVATDNGSAGWLGEIVVAPHARRHGTGSALTQALMQTLLGAGRRTLILTASEMGKPIYQRLGFHEETFYCLFNGRAPSLFDTFDGTVTPIESDSLTAISAFDAAATGENRSHLIRAFANQMPGGLVMKDRHGHVRGYTLVTPWETHPIVAEDAGSAIALLALLSQSEQSQLATITRDNIAGRDALEALGFVEQRRIVRMIYGEPLAWRPTRIWGTYSLGMG